jgi:hypothetical protein
LSEKIEIGVPDAKGYQRLLADHLGTARLADSFTPKRHRRSGAWDVADGSRSRSQLDETGCDASNGAHRDSATTSADRGSRRSSGSSAAGPERPQHFHEMAVIRPNACWQSPYQMLDDHGRAVIRLLQGDRLCVIFG